jgi:hypothetical protein
MRTTFIRIALVMMGTAAMGINSHAAAQVPLSPAAHQGWAGSHVDFAGSVGLAAISDHALEKYTTDVGGGIDVHLNPVWAIRGRVERSTFGLPGVSGTNGLHDAMTVTRTSIGVSRSTDESIRARFRPYLTGNVGLYHYGFVGVSGTHLTRVGGSGGMGFENLVADGHAAFTGEVLLHAVRGPENSPTSAYSFLVVTYTFGLKARF